MMNKKITRSLAYLFVIMALTLSSATYSLSAEYNAMKGVDSADTVYDFRIGDPKVAAIHLNLIHSMITDPAMMPNGSKPEIVVVFIGPSVKLVSTDKSGFDQDQQKQIDELADLLSKMEKDGFRFEICLAAVHQLNVKPESILPMIQQVDNGWISVVGYQHQGYALVSDF